MSRTFEVLERVQEDQELFRVPPVTKGTPRGGSTSATVSIPGLDASAREEVLKLVQSLFLATDGNGGYGPRRLVFCGVDEAYGSNQLCARVGRSLAEQVAAQVCVVDANLRMEASSPLFDLAPSGSSPPSEHGAKRNLLRQVTSNLWLASSESVVTNGRAPTLDQMQGLIRDLGDEFACLIVCAPPIGLYKDAVLLGQTAEGVVLVLEANSTRRMAARKAKQALEAANVRVLGMVLNNRTFPIPEKIYRRL